MGAEPRLERLLGLEWEDSPSVGWMPFDFIGGHVVHRAVCLATSGAGLFHEYVGEGLEVRSNCASLRSFHDRVGQSAKYPTEPGLRDDSVGVLRTAVHRFERVRHGEVQLAFDGPEADAPRWVELDHLGGPIEATSQDLAGATGTGAHAYRIGADLFRLDYRGVQMGRLSAVLR